MLQLGRIGHLRSRPESKRVTPAARGAKRGGGERIVISTGAPFRVAGNAVAGHRPAMMGEGGEAKSVRGLTPFLDLRQAERAANYPALLAEHVPALRRMSRAQGGIEGAGLKGRAELAEVMQPGQNAKPVQRDRIRIAPHRAGQALAKQRQIDQGGETIRYVVQMLRQSKPDIRRCELAPRNRNIRHRPASCDHSGCLTQSHF